MYVHTYVCVVCKLAVRSEERAETENGAGEGRSARCDEVRFVVIVAVVAADGSRVPVSWDDGGGTGDSDLEGKGRKGKERIIKWIIDCGVQ